MAMPVLQEDIAGSVQHEIDSSLSGSAFVAGIMERLKKENPCLATFIRTFSESTKDPKGTMCCGVLVYRMLESQSAADDLAREISDKC